MSTLKVNRIEPRTGDTVEIVGFSCDQPAFYTEVSGGNQTVSNAVDTKVLLASTAQRVDTGNVLDANGKCTITSETAGVWRFTGQVTGNYFESSCHLDRVFAMIFKNGSPMGEGSDSYIYQGGPFGLRTYTATVSVIAEVSAGEEIELYGNVQYSSTGTPSTLYIMQRATNFTGNRISS